MEEMVLVGSVMLLGRLSHYGRTIRARKWVKQLLLNNLRHYGHLFGAVFHWSYKIQDTRHKIQNSQKSSFSSIQPFIKEPQGECSAKHFKLPPITC